MCNVWRLICNDLKRLYQYKIVHIVIGVSFLFSAILAFFQRINPANLIYVTVFIMPVVIFSFSLHSDRIDQQMVPECDIRFKTWTVVLAKMVSALILQIIPIAFFMIVLYGALDMEINYLWLFLAYVFGVVLHILIGLSLAIIGKTNRVLSLSYIIYILLFCMGPIFLSNGLIPTKYEYFLLFSPAFLSGVLLDNILAGSLYSPEWLIILSSSLQGLYIILLSLFVIHPYFKNYLDDFYEMNDRDAQ
jgi:hypothetical protein